MGFSLNLGRKDSNLRMAVPKTAALPLGDAPARVKNSSNGSGEAKYFATTALRSLFSRETPKMILSFLQCKIFTLPIEKSMRIVHIATEFAPIAKAGGLGEVILGLSRELCRIGHEVEVILPKYDFIPHSSLQRVSLEVPDFKCFEKGQLHANAMWSAECEGIPLHLLEARHPAGYFHRGKIYGCDDDTARFLYFSRAAAEYLKRTDRPIDILHLHDWHSALAALFARDVFRLPVKAIALSIHNAAYQGKCAVWDLDYIGLPGQKHLTKDAFQDDDPAHPSLINILKGGLAYADAIVAVSPTYAKEILTPEYGYGLDPTFRKLEKKLVGILNGLDLKFWDPEKDRSISAHFKAKDPIETILNAKGQNRAALAKRFSLPAASRPWVGTITRLAYQKGPELIEAALLETIRLGGVFILLGSAPSPELRAHFENLKSRCKGQALLHFEYDEALAHEVYAALDFLVLPSRYEPCGLSQMIAMRYGTLPIARATGGHLDTIFDCDDPNIPSPKRNGFLFRNYSEPAQIEALRRAIDRFKKNPALLHALIKNGMSADWSWAKPAREYERLFLQLLRNTANR